MSFLSKTFALATALSAMTALTAISQMKKDTAKALTQPQHKHYGDITIHTDLNPAPNIALKTPYKKDGYVYLPYSSKSVPGVFNQNLLLVTKDGLNKQPDGIITPDEIVSFDLNDFDRRRDHQRHVNGKRQGNASFVLNARTTFLKSGELIEGDHTVTEISGCLSLKEFLPHIKAI